MSTENSYRRGRDKKSGKVISDNGALHSAFNTYNVCDYKNNRLPSDVGNDNV